MKTLAAVIASLLISPASANLFCATVPEGGPLMTFAWVIGQPAPRFVDSGGVVWAPDPLATVCSATDNELAYVRSRFSSIPMTNARYVVWEGEAAVFVANNVGIK